MKKIVSSFINIDSSNRKKVPENITGNLLNVPTNPFFFDKDSNIVHITAYNHNLRSNDNITVNNVNGFKKRIKNSISFITQTRYAIIENINHTNSGIVKIDIVDNNENVNISFINKITEIKKIIQLEEIEENIRDRIIAIIDNDNIINYIIIDAVDVYNVNIFSLEKINITLDIEYLTINNISTGYINADYPINNINRFQSSHRVLSIIDNNTFAIQLDAPSITSNFSGGNNIKIRKINNIIDGNPENNPCIIKLDKVYNNVINIRLLSTEIPFIDSPIYKDINDKLYWKNINDGNYIYSVQIESGFYTTELLLDTLTNKMNNVSSRFNTINYNKKNIFKIELNKINHQIIFKSFDRINAPDRLNIIVDEVDNELYYIMTLSRTDENLSIKVGDTIEVENSTDIIFNDQSQKKVKIPSFNINKAHTISFIYDKSYGIILGNINEINIEQVSSDSLLTLSGKNTVITINNKFSLLFDRKDTIGNFLGFKQVGSSDSITKFKIEISNSDNYYTEDINRDFLNSVGNVYNNNNGLINLSGVNNYMLMYLNDIRNIQNINLPASFAKILLEGKPGDILFNTHCDVFRHNVDNNSKIYTLSELIIEFRYRDGRYVNFNNNEYSFTLEIIENILDHS
jgi:hypothetical protein